MNTPKKGNKNLLNAWAFYDWANSVYSLVIASTIFPIFYATLTVVKNEKGDVIADQVRFLGRSFNNDSLISFVTALAFLFVSVISPFLSGVADYTGRKKQFLKSFCYVGGLSCIGLFWFDLEYLGLGLGFYFLALVGFWGSLVFYNSYLPDIAFPEQQDRVSAKGYSFGYIGSVVLLILCLLVIMNYQALGFENQDLPTRLAFVMTGIWWIGFAQISFVRLPGGKREEKPRRKVLLNGFKELRMIWEKLKHDLRLKRYLRAFFVYSMAVQTVMLIATYFGIEEVNWTGQDATTGLIVSILLIQLVAIGGAMLTSRISAGLGNIKTLILINLVWTGICVFAYFIHTPLQFYIAAGLVGLVMGGIQTLSRSTYSKMLPRDTADTTSYFSFYDVTEKIGIVIGMILYGTVAELFGSIRVSVLFLTAFFLIGIVLLLRIPKNSSGSAAE